MAATETKLLANPADPTAWQQALYAFLAEEERRSGSRRTVEGYSRTLQHFFGVVGKTPDLVTSPEVLSWAHGVGLSGREPSAVTIGACTACLSSFYKFLIRMSIVQANPCDALERPKVQPSPARGFTALDVQKILAVIPDTVAGRRDRAIVLALVITGRRRARSSTSGQGTSRSRASAASTRTGARAGSWGGVNYLVRPLTPCWSRSAMLGSPSRRWRRRTHSGRRARANEA